MSVRSSWVSSRRKSLKLKGKYHTVIRWGNSLRNWAAGFVAFLFGEKTHLVLRTQLSMCKGSRRHWLPLSQMYNSSFK